jgi:tetratricopeptide (TPR) repeat protein
MKTLLFTLFMLAGATAVYGLEVYPVPVGGLYPPTTESAAMLDARLARPGPPSASASVRELLWSIRGGLQLSRFVDDSRYREYLHFSLDELKGYASMTLDDQKAWTVLGVRLLQDRQVEAAYKAMARARAIDPGDTRSAEIFSAVLVLDGQIERATRESRRLLDAMPDNPTIRFNLACALSLHGEAEEALHHLELLAATGWEALLYNLYDRDLDKLARHPQFLNLLERVLQQHQWRLRSVTPPDVRLM